MALGDLLDPGALEQLQPATVNPLMAAKFARQRAQVTPPTSVMDDRWAESQKRQREADYFLLASDLATAPLGLPKGAVTGAAKYAGRTLADLTEGHMRKVGMMPDMIAYHGTQLPDIETFDRLAGSARRQGFTSMNEIGHWFDATPEGAKKFGPNVLKRDVQLENPMPLRDMEEFRTLWQESQGRERTKAYKDAWSGKGDPEKFRAFLAQQGYDGVHIKGGEFGSDYYVAIHPEQIKRVLEGK